MVIYAEDFYISKDGSRPSGISFDVLDHFVEFANTKYGVKLALNIFDRKDHGPVLPTSRNHPEVLLPVAFL